MEVVVLRRLYGFVAAVIPAVAFISRLSTGAAQTGPVTPTNPTLQAEAAATATGQQSGVVAGASTVSASSPTLGNTASGVAVAGLTAPIPAASSDHTAAHERLIDGASHAALANPLNWAVHAHKSRHEVEVYYRGHLYQTYHAVFGRSRWAGAKAWEGDGRTPEGPYLLVGKHRSHRFRWFLHLNYPNSLDRAKFAELRAAREIPASIHEGGQIGIHGTDNQALNDGNVNWTTGCISLDNSDISELARLLPIGTLVVIEP
jgi:lipoprotein-anchoring transpeptidase ErfK/SrfK